jgi:SAM-dependent methyltransferase
LTGPVDWINLRQTLLVAAHRTKLYDVSYWDKEAGAVNKNVSQLTKLTSHQVKLLPLNPDYTVLDVGAGTGRITIPMAKHSKHVTALEPSAKMLAILRENAMEKHAFNISYINQSLEALDTPVSYDLVVASFSLFMLDLEKALLKMNKLASKAVYLFMSASPWVAEGLQKAVYGKIDLSSDFILTYNILHDIGVVANVDVYDYESILTYTNIEEAATMLTERYCLPQEKRSELTEYLKANLAEEDGKLCYKRKMKAATIWWKTNK